MLTASSTDVKTHFGEYLEKAIKEPIAVTKTGRPAAVIISIEEYERLQALEDKVWGEKSMEADKNGYLGPEKSMAFVKEQYDKHGLPIPEFIQ